MADFFSPRWAARLLLLTALWLTAVRGAAQPLPSPPLEEAGDPFLRFSLTSPVDQWDGSATADFLLFDGDRPVPAAEIDVIAAFCRCRVEEEIHVLPLSLETRDGSAAFSLVLQRGAACSVIAKLRYRGALYVVQAMRRVYARGRDPADWEQDVSIPKDVPYLAAEEESYNFRTGIPMTFTLQQGESAPTTVAVYDKERRLLETLSVQEAFTYEVPPLPPLKVPGRGSRENVFFAAQLREGEEPLHLFAQISVVHDRRLYLNILHGAAVFFLAGGVTAAVIFMRRRRRRA